MESTQPYFLLSLSAIGSLLLIGVGLLISALKGVRKDVSEVNDKQSEQGEKLVRIETILTGADGTNGINGEVKRLRDRVDDWDRRIGEPERRRA